MLTFLWNFLVAPTPTLSWKDSRKWTNEDSVTQRSILVQLRCADLSFFPRQATQQIVLYLDPSNCPCWLMRSLTVSIIILPREWISDTHELAYSIKKKNKKASNERWLMVCALREATGRDGQKRKATMSMFQLGDQNNFGWRAVSLWPTFQNHSLESDLSSFAGFLTLWIHRCCSRRSLHILLITDSVDLLGPL